MKAVGSGANITRLSYRNHSTSSGCEPDKGRME